MKRSVFRMMAALLCLVMLPGLAACGKGGKTRPEAAEEAGAGQLPVIAPEWQSSFVTLQSDSLWGLRPVRYTDDGFYATFLFALLFSLSSSSSSSSSLSQS